MHFLLFSKLFKKLFFLLALTPAVDKVSIETISDLTSVTSWNKRNVYGFHGSWHVIGYDPIFPIDQESAFDSVSINQCPTQLLWAYSFGTHTHTLPIIGSSIFSLHT